MVSAAALPRVPWQCGTLLFATSAFVNPLCEYHTTCASLGSLCRARSETVPRLQSSRPIRPSTSPSACFSIHYNTATMSTRSRGRGLSERGARGANTRGRGTAPRGTFNGHRMAEPNGGAISNTFTPRGPRADRGQRGGIFRGDTNSRGNTRARGGQMYDFPSFKTD